MLLLVGFMMAPAFAQQTRKDREARKEIRMEERRMERAIRDSLRLCKENTDSVNVGYGYVKKSKLTNSVSSVGIDQNEIASYSDIGEYLQGRVPGLTVVKDGARYRFMIREIGTINGTSEPLIIVDGVEVSDISYLNPRDIRSVEVLKDSSAAIYGVRGAFGVILITTRR